jgi:hypothetical protein
MRDYISRLRSMLDRGLSLISMALAWAVVIFSLSAWLFLMIVSFTLGMVVELSRTMFTSKKHTQKSKS